MIDHTGIGVAEMEPAAAFYDAALGALGYPPGCCAAFVLDPDGNSIEAVCRSGGQTLPTKGAG